MADDAIVANLGVGGATFASDQIGGIEYPRAKLVWGANGTATDASASDPLPVVQTGALPTGNNNVGDVDVATIAAGDNNIGNVDIVTVPTDPFGANADAASATGSISAKLRGISTALGITALDLGSGTGGSRTLRTYLDTAQTALVSPGLSASVSVTRPSDTNVYAANDVVGVTGGGTATITFALGAVSASRILITGASLMRNASALISGETNYILHLYDVTQPGAQADNAAFDLAAGDRTAYLGNINLGTPVDLGSTLFVEQTGLNKPVKLAGTSIYGVLVTVGTYTPASAAVHVVTLHAIQL